MSLDRRLVLGLGNPMAGDDGIGSHLARRLQDHPRLPSDTDVLEGGTDLFRLAHELDDRPWVILMDALLDPAEPGSLVRFDGELDELEGRGGGVHHLSPIQALRLLRCLYPSLRAVPITFLGITIRDVRISHTLSPALHARLDDLTEEILAMLADRPVVVAAGDTG
jgi:hydrogenase maturation protease